MTDKVAGPDGSALSEGLERARWRPVVAAFADAMEAKLRANDHKGGWQDDAPHELVRRLIEETAEVIRAMSPQEKAAADFRASALMLDAAAGILRRWGPGLRTSADQDTVRGECADVGNFALMVADRFGAL